MEPIQTTQWIAIVFLLIISIIVNVSVALDSKDLNSSAKYYYGGTLVIIIWLFFTIGYQIGLNH